MVKVNKYIFLDIDGVLNCITWFEQNKNKPGYTEIDPNKVRLLKEIVDRTGADIILSSSWRELYTLNDGHEHEMYTYLTNSLNQFGLHIKEHTPYISDNRPLEIKTWLEENEKGNPVSFVSLDDDYPYEWYERYGIENCLIQTSFYTPNGGLNEEHVKKAIEILNNGNN